MNVLAERYATLKQSEPRMRIVDAARTLGVSELELVLLDPRTQPLQPRPDALLEGLSTVGEAMALTRNPWCVHERRGRWSTPTFHGGGSMGLVVGPDIDLRLFLRSWAHLVHTVVDNAHGPLASFQVFDAAGTAVHKVYRTDASDTAAWDALVDQLAAVDRMAPTLRPRADAAPDRPDADVDVDALRTAWSALKDTHDFHPMLRTHGVGRTQALRLVGAPWALRVDPKSAVDSVLNGVAGTGEGIMVFVGNPGCIQIHTGPVERVAWRGDWLNVLDPMFNLHLDTGGLADAWAVRKPTVDGPVHSLELFASDGTLVVQLFGARKPGIPEDPRWTARIAALTPTR